MTQASGESRRLGLRAIFSSASRSYSERDVFKPVYLSKPVGRLAACVAALPHLLVILLVCSAIAARATEDPQVLAAQAAQALQQEDFRRAQALYERLIAQFPDIAEAYS